MRRISERDRGPIAALVVVTVCVVISLRYPTSADVTANCSYERVLVWGGFGQADGRFNHLIGVGVDDSGFVYATDMFNHRLQKFTSDGDFVLKWGSYGSGDGQLNSPHGLAIGPSGHIHVADMANHRIQEFTSDGVFVAKWGSHGSGPDQFVEPRGVAVGPTGDVYVADTGNHRIQKFTADGEFAAQWGSYGSANGQFDSPWDAAVDEDGFVYIVDQGNNRIQKLTADGVFVTEWGSYGVGLGQFDQPVSVVVGDNRRIYVADGANGRIQVFTPAGDFVLFWVVPRPPALGALWDQSIPTGIDLDGNGLAYVADTWSNHVNVFEPRPTGLDHIVAQDAPGGQGREITYHVMAISDTLTIYAARYDACHNCLGSIPVDWATSGSLDLQTSTGISFTFSPVTSQTMGTIVADDGNGHVGETGPILVDWEWPFDVYLPYVGRD